MVHSFSLICPEHECCSGPEPICIIISIFHFPVSYYQPSQNLEIAAALAHLMICGEVTSFVSVGILLFGKLLNTFSKWCWHQCVSRKMFTKYQKHGPTSLGIFSIAIQWSYGYIALLSPFSALVNCFAGSVSTISVLRLQVHLEQSSSFMKIRRGLAKQPFYPRVVFRNSRRH